MSSLNVMVMEASGLDVRASSGVYATVTLGDQTLKTSTVRGEDPVWNDTVIFAGTSMSATYASKLDVKVMGASRSASGADMCLGCITVPVNRIAIGREVEVWFSLRSPDEPEGPVVGEGSASRGKLLLSFVLDGPMRKEVQAAIGLWGTYTTAIDSLLSHTTGLSDAIMPVVTNRAVVAAAIPATAVAAVAIIPALLIAAPVVLPALLFGGALLGLLAILAGFVLAGSRTGRDKVASTLGPIRRKLKETAVGQQLVYETGPRPSINAVMKAFAPEDMWSKLALSIAIDVIGCSSYAIPILGEAGDIAWAPISALLINAMYHSSSPYAGYFGFAEEIMPFTDFIPTATLAWLREFGPAIISAAREMLVGPPSPP